MHSLEPGAGGLVSPTAVKSNPMATPSPQQAEALYGQSPPEVSPMMQAFGGVLDQAKAQYQKLTDFDQRLKAVRTQLDQLVAKGDTVNTEDLIDAGAELVAHGIGAVPVATLLADAPTTGEALQAWLKQQDQTVTRQEAALQKPLAMARHQMAVAGLHNFVGHMAEAQAQQATGAAGPQAGGGPLGPTGGPPAAAEPPESEPTGGLSPAVGGENG